jgi:hypothetical protein
MPLKKGHVGHQQFGTKSNARSRIEAVVKKEIKELKLYKSTEEG